MARVFSDAATIRLMELLRTAMDRRNGNSVLSDEQVMSDIRDTLTREGHRPLNNPTGEFTTSQLVNRVRSCWNSVNKRKQKEEESKTNPAVKTRNRSTAWKEEAAKLFGSEERFEGVENAVAAIQVRH